MTTTDDRRLEDWLRRFRWALASIDLPERDDIVAETRAHLADRIEGGTSLTSALAALGPPEVYARGFVDEMEYAGALGSQRPRALFRVVLRRAHRSVVAAIAFLVLAILFLVALATVMLVVMKVQDPAHVGLWLGGGNEFIGTIDDPTRAREMLGASFYPLAGIILVASWIIGHLTLVFAVRTLARTR